MPDTTSAGRIRIMPYASSSASGRALKDVLASVYTDNRDVLRIHNQASSEYVAMDRDIIINWGTSREMLRNTQVAGVEDHSDTYGIPITVFNKSRAISNAVYKTAAYKIFDENDIPTVQYLHKPAAGWHDTERTLIEKWMEDSGIIMRDTQRSHGGSNTTYIKAPDVAAIDRCKLITKYIPKKKEYRINVMDDGTGNYNAFDIIEKKRSYSVPREDVDWQIRSQQCGWVFARNNIDVPDDAISFAIQAVKALNLTFGAVDVILGVDNSLYVLEVNTAPGMCSPTTILNYARSFHKLITNTENANAV